MWVTLVELRPMVEVSAVDTGTGDSILLRPFTSRTLAEERVRIPLTTDPETRFVGVPSQNVTLHVDYKLDAKPPSSGREIFVGNGEQGNELQPNPDFSLYFFRGAEAQPSHKASLHSGDTVNVNGVRYLITFGYDATLRSSSALWWIAVAAGWGMVALSLIALVVASPVYIRGSIKSVETGSQISLTVDILGDEQRWRRELRDLIIPDV